MRGHRDLTATVSLAAICAVGALAIPLDPLRIPFALPLCLVLPGYAITAAAFARRRLSRAQIALFSVALSLCALALGALALNYLGGLHSLTWALYLLVLVVALCRLAATRRVRPSGPPVRPRIPGVPPIRALIYATGLLAAVAAVAAAFVSLPAKNALGFTELWIDTEARQATTLIQVGVRSQEQAAGSYFIRVRVGDEEEPVIRLLDLSPAETRVVRLAVPTPALRTRVTASLFRQSDPEAVYRRVYTWIPDGGG